MIFFWVIIFEIGQYMDIAITTYLLATTGLVKINPLIVSGICTLEQFCVLKIALCAAVLVYAIWARLRGEAKTVEAWIAFMAGMSMMPVIYNLVIWRLSR